MESQSQSAEVDQDLVSAVTRKDIWKYFSKTNHINKSIIGQERSFVKYLDNRWSDIPSERQDALLDLIFVNDQVREVFDEKNDDDVQESFPRLLLDSGQKINVDFESDLWTWRDEHSGPFSWMSKSQQDLTLADLEPETISKPQPKTARVESEEPPKKAEKQFSHPSNSWCLDIVGEFKKNEHKVTLTPSSSINLSIITVEQTPEEHNPACYESATDNSELHDHNQESSEGPETCDEEKVDTTSEKKSKNKDRSRRSPSPKKIIRSGSFKKSPVKSADQQLITEEDPDLTDGNNAFSNPVMENEWSTFVGEEAQTETSFTQNEKMSTAPAGMTMDRGDMDRRSEDIHADSPYRGDRLQLIEPSSSPSVKLSSPSVSGWSEESTPDHTTHLLKGLQSPVHHRNNQAYVASDNDSDLAVHQAAPAERDLVPDTYQKVETDEEVLRVEMDGGNITVTSEVESTRDSSIFKTGFDFLDNW